MKAPFSDEDLPKQMLNTSVDESRQYSTKQKSTHAIQLQVEYMAEAGFALHRLHPKSKRPIGDDWSDKPVATLAELQRRWRPGENVGVRLGKWSVVAGLYLHIIDMDIRADDDTAARAMLAELLPSLDLESTPTVQSGSGGASRHFYLLTERPFRSKKFAHSDGFQMVRDESKGRDVKKWDWELHLLGTGAQAAIPPSIHPDSGLPYRWLRQFDFDLLELGIATAFPADELANALDEHDEAAEPNERNQPLRLEQDEIVKILDALPAAEWFEDRDQWMRVGMALHHETGGAAWAFDLWCQHSKISQKFDAKDQRRVWRSFKNRSATPFRMATLISAVKESRILAAIDALPETDDLDAAPATDDPGAYIDAILAEPEESLSAKAIRLRKEAMEITLGRGAPPRIRRLNRKHAVARVSGKTVILDFHPDGRVSYGSVTDLNNYYENDRVATEKSTEPVTKMWLRHKQRREYPNGIVFAPQGGPEGAYNHWQGFSIEPDNTKSCRLFVRHLREVVCNGDEESYRWLIGWLAHMIQKPWEKPGVAVVLRGAKGSGKDTVAEYVGGLFKPHYITIGNKDQLVGKFNAHQEKCLLLHVQEGFWAGDKRDEGPLKYLITSPSVMIEPKGMNAFPIDSVLRVFISSNERWVVPATEDERRFFVLNVSPARMKDSRYFEALRREMETGGRQALLHHLMGVDLADFDVRRPPVTAALAEQKLESLRNVERWWFDTLSAADIGARPHGNDDLDEQPLWETASLRVLKDDLRNAYQGWLRDHRFEGSPVTMQQFGQRLKALCPTIDDVQLRLSSVRRPRAYVVPPLQACREAFTAVMGIAVSWE